MPHPDKYHEEPPEDPDWTTRHNEPDATRDRHVASPVTRTIEHYDEPPEDPLWETTPRHMPGFGHPQRELEEIYRNRIFESVQYDNMFNPPKDTSEDSHIAFPKEVQSTQPEMTRSLVEEQYLSVKAHLLRKNKSASPAAEDSVDGDVANGRDYRSLRPLERYIIDKLSRDNNDTDRL